MSQIKISPKHGVNPSIQKCFFCGKDKGLVLFGKLKGDGEAPKECVTDYEPCDECLKIMQGNVLLMGITDKPATLPDKRPMIDKTRNLYPTGSFTVIKPDAFKRVAEEYMQGIDADEIIEKGKAFVDDGVINFINKLYEAATKHED